MKKRIFLLFPFLILFFQSCMRNNFELLPAVPPVTSAPTSDTDTSDTAKDTAGNATATSGTATGTPGNSINPAPPPSPAPSVTPAENCSPNRPTGDNPIVGAIRWDGWFSGSGWSHAITKKDASTSWPQWPLRLPFYSTTLYNGDTYMASDTQDVMDMEIAYAQAGGLNYWAFDYYSPLAWDAVKQDGSGHFQTDFSKTNPDAPFGRSLNLYLSSSKKKYINYSLVVGPSVIGPPTEWPNMINFFVKQFSDCSYQKVMGNRPILYWMGVPDWFFAWGLEMSGKKSLYCAQATCTQAEKDAYTVAQINLLRAQSKAVGLGNPYIVYLDWYPSNAIDSAARFGFDAVSSYTNPLGATGAETKGRITGSEYPYSPSTAFGCTWLNKSFRDATVSDADKRNIFEARGMKLVPPVATGWDFRPILGDPSPFSDGRPWNGDWCRHATGPQIATHLSETINWVKAHPNIVDAKTILIYAWNELSEGGFLLPTRNIYELVTTERLDALRGVLSPSGRGILKPIQQNLVLDAWVLWGCRGCNYPQWWVENFPVLQGAPPLDYLGNPNLYVPPKGCTGLLHGATDFQPCPSGYSVGPTTLLGADNLQAGSCASGAGAHLKIVATRTCYPPP